MAIDFSPARMMEMQRLGELGQQGLRTGGDEGILPAEGSVGGVIAGGIANLLSGYMRGKAQDQQQAEMAAAQQQMQQKEDLAEQREAAKDAGIPLGELYGLTHGQKAAAELKANYPDLYNMVTDQNNASKLLLGGNLPGFALGQEPGGSFRVGSGVGDGHGGSGSKQPDWIGSNIAAAQALTDAFNGGKSLYAPGIGNDLGQFGNAAAGNQDKTMIGGLGRFGASVTPGLSPYQVNEAAWQDANKKLANAAYSGANGKGTASSQFLKSMIMPSYGGGMDKATGLYNQGLKSLNDSTLARISDLSLRDPALARAYTEQWNQAMQPYASVLGQQTTAPGAASQAAPGAYKGLNF